MLSPVNGAEAHVAEWMLSRLESDGVLYQADAAYLIVERFGERYCYYTDSGYLAIDLKVLYHFKRKANGRVAWFPNTKSWRM